MLSLSLIVKIIKLIIFNITIVGSNYKHPSYLHYKQVIIRLDNRSTVDLFLFTWPLNILHKNCNK